MPIVEIKIKDTSHHITCDEKNKDRVEIVSQHLNEYIKKIQKQLNTKNASSISIIIIAALQLQDELLEMMDVFSKTIEEKNIEINTLKSTLIKSEIDIENNIKKLESIIQKSKK